MSEIARPFPAMRHAPNGVRGGTTRRIRSQATTASAPRARRTVRVDRPAVTPVTRPRVPAVSTNAPQAPAQRRRPGGQPGDIALPPTTAAPAAAASQVATEERFACGRHRTAGGS